jgi:DNA-binding transcriptional ArsR family regulator
MEENRIKENYLIKDIETLRVIADPLRTQIMELLVHDSMTVRQVAEKLGLAAGKLYYHFSLLEKHGLVHVVETRQVANMIEKLYRATAASLDVDPSLLTFTTEQGKESIHALLTAMLDSTREDLQRSLQARAFSLERGADPKQRRVLVNRLMSRIPDAQAEEFTERLESLLKEFELADQDPNLSEEELHPYAFAVAFYPSFFFEEDHEGDPGAPTGTS